MNLRPVTITDAKKFVQLHHRHHRPPLSGLFAVGIEEAEQLVGVAIIGRPVARLLQDGYTAEVTRVCTNGIRNGCSMLYSAAWRACRALGYKRLITYTLPEEGGGSLRASNWKLVGVTAGGRWTRPSRPRFEEKNVQPKLRWEVPYER